MFFWQCSASSVTIALSATPSAGSKVCAAGISLDFSAMSTWASTRAVSVANALNIWAAARSLKFGGEQGVHCHTLILRQRPEPLAERNHRLDALDPLVRKMLPGPARRLPHHQFDGFRHGAAVLERVVLHPRREGGFVAVHHALQNMRRCDAGRIGPPCRHCKRAAQANEIVRRIADHGLVEVTHL